MEVFGSGHTACNDLARIVAVSEDHTSKTVRTWQDIAHDLLMETNRERIHELARELNLAILEQEPKATKS